MPEPKPTLAPTKPPLMRFKEFLQNFHDVEEYSPDRSFCFIIGSGASHTAGIPTGGSLVNRWLVEMHDMDDSCTKRILPPHAKIQDYADALLEGETERLKTWSEKRFAGLKDYSFENRASSYGNIYKARFASDPSLGEEFLRKLIVRRNPSIGYHLLARILNRTRHKVVITTNFDHLVEDSIAITENEAIQSFGHGELAAFVQSRPQHPVVAKIHGDILLKTYNATDEIGKLNEQWREPLKALFHTHTPIVIGYGGNDPGFMKFLMAETQTWEGNRRCYWFVRKETSFGKIPYSPQLATVKALRVVECPGFTELMLKLNEIFGFEPLHEELKKRVSKIASELNEADIKARGDLAEHERRALESIRIADSQSAAIASATSTTAAPVTVSPRTWQQWRDLVAECVFPDQRKKLLADALLAFPGNAVIRAADIVRSLYDNPADLELVQKLDGLLKNSEKEEGPESEQTLSLLFYAGLARWILGMPENAETIFRRVIAERQRMLGLEHPDVLDARNALGLALNAQGKHAAAQAEHRAVLEIHQRVLGLEHRETLANLHNLATSLSKQGKHAEAEELHKSVAETCQRTLGPEHPHTLQCRNNLAVTLRAQGKYPEAEAEHRAVLEIRQRMLAPEHPDIFESCHNLAFCLLDQGKHSEGLELANQAWVGRRKNFGETHSLTKSSQNLVHLLEELV